MFALAALCVSSRSRPSRSDETDPCKSYDLSLYRLSDLIFFAIFGRSTLRDFIKLRFVGARQLRMRWLDFKVFADQALVNDPKAPQLLLDLAESVAKQTQVEETKSQIDAIRKSLAAGEWPPSTPAAPA